MIWLPELTRIGLASAPTLLPSALKKAVLLEAMTNWLDPFRIVEREVKEGLAKFMGPLKVIDSPLTVRLLIVVPALETVPSEAGPDPVLIVTFSKVVPFKILKEKAPPFVKTERSVPVVKIVTGLAKLSAPPVVTKDIKPGLLKLREGAE